MKIKLALFICFLGLVQSVHANGFIIISDRAHISVDSTISAMPMHRRLAFMPLEVSKHHVDVKIRDQIATTTVEQEFFNPGNRQLEGTYFFPIPKNAHIDKFSMEIDGKMVDAELLPADAARKIYEDIVRRMKDPALMEYVGCSMFKVRVFPIEPRSKKPIKITYTELLKSDAGMVTYSYPFSAEKLSEKPAQSLKIKVDIQNQEALASIYSPSHAMRIKRDGNHRAMIEYDAKNEKPDTDFQLVFATDKQNVGLHLMSYKKSDEDGYFLLLASPSAEIRGGKPAPKDVVFVLDSSGSMSGDKLKQAKKALAFCVENLNEEDRFEIVRFSTEAEPFFGKAVTASEANRNRANKFIKEIKAIGGTAIADALATALKAKPTDDLTRPFVVIFLTDGCPTVGPRRPEEILAVARKHDANARIFSFGIGSDVNTQLLDQLAESTRAFSQYVLEEEDIEVKVSNFFTRIKEPALTNLKLEFAGSVKARLLYPADLPDLFKGDQLVLVGRYSGSGEVEAKLTGNAAGQAQNFTYKVRFSENDNQHDFIPQLWATRRVGFLLDEIRIHGENPELRQEVSSLAHEFGIVTPFTAYLILEDEDRRKVPAELRSLQRMRADRAAVSLAKDEYYTFNDAKVGAQAVANAQSQNSFKFADQASAGRRAGNSVAISGITQFSKSREAAAAAGRVEQYTQQARYVNGRAFFQNGNQWIDSNTQNLTKRQQVQFNSDEYYALAAKHPEINQWLALSSNMLLAVGDTIYEITD